MKDKLQVDIVTPILKLGCGAILLISLIVIVIIIGIVSAIQETLNQAQPFIVVAGIAVITAYVLSILVLGWFRSRLTQKASVELSALLQQYDDLQVSAAEGRQTDLSKEQRFSLPEDSYSVRRRIGILSHRLLEGLRTDHMCLGKLAERPPRRIRNDSALAGQYMRHAKAVSSQVYNQILDWSQRTEAHRAHVAAGTTLHNRIGNLDREAEALSSKGQKETGMNAFELFCRYIVKLLQLLFYNAIYGFEKLLRTVRLRRQIAASIDTEQRGGGYGSPAAGSPSPHR